MHLLQIFLFLRLQQYELLIQTRDINCVFTLSDNDNDSDSDNENDNYGFHYNMQSTSHCTETDNNRDSH